MEKEKIKRILIDSINSFENIASYEMIGIFGSITDEGKEFEDLDLVSMGDNRVHKKFRDYLIKRFKEEGIKIKFFLTITEKPEADKKVLLVHDLHYSNIRDLLCKEWKIIIDVMRKDLLVLYGNNIIRDLPKQKISKNDLFLPFLKWIKNIDNYNKYELFEDNILKHLKKDFYDYGFKEEGDRIKKIFNSDEDWKIKLDKIKEILMVS